MVITKTVSQNFRKTTNLNTMKNLITLTALLFSIASFSQDIKNENEEAKTKMESFTSKTGVITKFTDTNLSNLKSSYTVSETRVRKVNSGDMEKYFFQIEKPGKYDNATASIEYSDLLELIKALNSLKNEVEVDISNNPDYLENKFITEDGFQLGYFIKNGKTTWYIRLEKYGSDKTLFIKNLSDIESNFLEAKNKIEALKS